MSGTRPTPAEQHLGDRLAALIDGELGHDARERVLAHLATCPRCKSEADAQRSLKNVFAQAAPPPPTESFLARLQGLSTGDGDGQDGGPGSGLGLGLRGESPLRGGFGVRATFPARPDPFVYAPTDGHGLLPPSDGRTSGFRIHPLGRVAQGQEAERAASRGRRFAFAAAGAVSLAAIALGGVSTVATGPGGESRGASNALPQGAPASGSATADSARRRGTTDAQARSTPETASPTRGRALAAGGVMAGAPLLPAGSQGRPPLTYLGSENTTAALPICPFSATGRDHGRTPAPFSLLPASAGPLLRNTSAGLLPPRETASALGTDSGQVPATR